MIVARASLCVLMFTACAHGAAEQKSPRHGLVPDQAPDTIPHDIRANADAEFGIPLDIVVLSFKSGLSRQVKDTIVAEIHGNVVGGMRQPPGLGVDGFYIVRIPKTPGITALDRVTAQLRGYPEVVSASMFIGLDTFGR